MDVTSGGMRRCREGLLTLLLAWGLGGGVAVGQTAVGHWETRLWGAESGTRAMAVDRDDRLWMVSRSLTAVRTAGVKLQHWDGRTWDPPRALGGTSTAGFRMASWEDQVFLGGAFTSVDGVPATNVARFSGTQWGPMDAGLTGGNGRVNALAVWRGEPVAAGSFNTSGTTQISGIAVWRGERWEPLGSSPSGEYVDLLAREDALYAVVGAPSWGVFRYSDAGWERLAQLRSGLLEGGRSWLTWFEGRLHVLSQFVSTDGTTLGPVKRLEDGRWVSVVPPGRLTGSFYGLFTLQGHLYAGGSLAWVDNGTTNAASVVRLSGGGPSVSLGSEAGIPLYFAVGERRAYVLSTANNLSEDSNALRSTLWQFDGESWSPLNSGPAGSYVANRVVVTPQGPVLGGESISTALQPNQVHLWDGQRLVPTTSPDRDGSGRPVPYASGPWVFRLADGVYATSRPGTDTNAEVVLRLSGRSWTPATRPIGFRATRLAGSSSRLWAAAAVGTDLRISRWEGGTWNPEPGAGAFQVVRLTDLTEFGGRVFASGQFSERSTGRTMQALVRGADGWKPWEVFDGVPERLVVAGDRLLVAGRFTEADGTRTQGLVSWDGATWTDLSEGLTATGFGAVASRSDGVLAAAGSFTFAGSTNIAVRRDGRWEGLANGLGPETAIPSDLAWDGPDLWVVGNFTSVQQRGVETESRGVAIWRDGTARLEPLENAAGERGFRIAGDVDGAPTLSASSDLTDWTPLRTVRATDPRRWIPATNGVVEPVRFLRLR